jgi:hypothetical protein
MSNRTPGSPSAPPPPKRPGAGDDALSEYLGASGHRRKISGRPAAHRPAESHQSIIGILQDSGGSVPVEDLQQRAGLHFVDFTTALVELEHAGRIRLSGPPGQETIGIADEAS